MVCGSVSPNDSRPLDKLRAWVMSSRTLMCGQLIWSVGLGRTNRVVGHAPADTSLPLILLNPSSCNVVRRAFHASRRWRTGNSIRSEVTSRSRSQETSQYSLSLRTLLLNEVPRAPHCPRRQVQETGELIYGAHERMR